MAAKSKVETRKHKTKQQHNLLVVTVPVHLLVKVKVTVEHATKFQRWSRCTALLFLQPRRYIGVGS